MHFDQVSASTGDRAMAALAATGADDAASHDTRDGQPAKDAKDQPSNQLGSRSTEASPDKLAAAPTEQQQDELVQILTKGAEGNANQKQFVNQFVLPNQRQRTREEIEKEVLDELREIDRFYNIV